MNSAISIESNSEAIRPGVAFTDIGNCFKLFLAQDPPTPDECSRWLGKSMQDFLSELFRTEAFRTKVLGPVLLREPLPFQSVSATPPWSILDWAQQRLPLSDGSLRAIGLVRSWELLLEITLADPALNSLSQDLSAAGISKILADRVKNEPALHVKHTVAGALDSASSAQVRGWAIDYCHKLTRVRLDFFADTIFLGTAVCNEPRPDVQDHVGGDGSCGFTFLIPSAHRMTFASGRLVRAVDAISRQQIGGAILVHADPTKSWDAIEATRQEIIAIRKSLERVERSIPDLSRLASVPVEAYDAYWDRFYRPSTDVLDEQRRTNGQFSYKPLISIVMPTWNSDTGLLDAALTSVRDQSYDRWELLIADDASDVGDQLRRLQRRHVDADPRIQLIEGTERGGISTNTDRAIALCSGDYIAFLDHDDLLAPDALFEIVKALQHRRYGLIYSDEDRIERDESGRTIHHSPFFKPDFDPDLLSSMNYICHLVVVKRELVIEIGGFRQGFEGAQDHDLLLRLTEILSSEDIHHLARVLYHWRVTSGSVSQTASRTTEINRTIVKAVAEHLARTGADAQVSEHLDTVGSSRGFATRVRWRLPSPTPSVSIIVPTRDRLDLLQPCIESLLSSRQAYPGLMELLIVDNDSREAATLTYLMRIAREPGVSVIPFLGHFNWSAINNFAASKASGDVLIFLNNDTVVLTTDWCAELVSHAARAEVGAVGPRLLYHDGTIQHAAVVLGVEGVAGHEAVGDIPHDGGYFGRTHVLRGTAAVTGACLATRRSLFVELGGFDDIDLKVAFNDVDYCLKLSQAGYRIIYNPFATLYHFESKSRGRDVTEAQQTRHRIEARIMRERWGDTLDADRYYNPHFERYARPFSRLRPPPRLP